MRPTPTCSSTWDTRTSLDKDLQGAVYWLREAVRRNPADDAAHYVLGVALQASGSTAEAAREKELARQLSSTFAEWEAKQTGANTVPRGLERVKTDIDVAASFRVESAIVASEQRDQRELATFHLDRGRRLFQQELDEEAIAELRRVVYLSPYQSEAHLLLGRIYLRTGRPHEAIERAEDLGVERSGQRRSEAAARQSHRRHRALRLRAPGSELRSSRWLPASAGRSDGATLGGGR